jgi:hypothetical protein
VQLSCAGAKMRYEERERSDLRAHERKKMHPSAPCATVRMRKRAHPKPDAAVSADSLKTRTQIIIEACLGLCPKEQGKNRNISCGYEIFVYILYI